MKKIDSSTLAALVRERERFLTKIVPFIEMLVGKRGKTMVYDERDSRTHTVQRLEDFGGFSFETESGIYHFGDGNRVTVWSGERGGIPEHKVLEVHWSTSFDLNDPKTKVSMNHRDGYVEVELLKLMERWKEIASAQDTKLSEAEKRKKAEKKAEEEERAQEEKLRLKAERLGIRT